MRVVILVPYRPDGGQRDKLWTFCKEWLQRIKPDWPIFEHPGPSGLFNRSAAINLASDAAGPWDIAFVMDTDVIVNEEGMLKCLETAMGGGLAIPHSVRVDLTQRGTSIVLNGSRSSWVRPGMVAKRWTDSVSLCVAVPRLLWDKLGGFDPNFVGWGYEDSAFIAACDRMGVPLTIHDTEAFHLWHARSDNPHRQANWDLLQVYEDSESNLGALLADSNKRMDEIREEFEEISDGLIPRIFHRTVPESVDPQLEEWWEQRMKLHPLWQFRTYRDPIDERLFPQTSPYWERCETGAQKADLIRLEALYQWGGVYVDSDCCPVGRHDSLRNLRAFAAWEDETTIPNAVMGSIPGHPAIATVLDLAIAGLKRGDKTYATGVALTTKVFKDRDDMLILPPGIFYPHHYEYKRQAGQNNGPWTIEEHMWHHSWGTERERANIARRQK